MSSSQWCGVELSQEGLVSRRHFPNQLYSIVITYSTKHITTVGNARCWLDLDDRWGWSQVARVQFRS